MKTLKKHTLLFALMLCMLANICACGSVGGFGTKDVSTLVQGNIDHIYLGKYDAEYLKMVDITEEEAEADYLDGLQMEAEFFASYWGIIDTSYGESYDDLDESLQAEIIDLYKEIYSHTQYEIQSVTKLDDGSYSVKVLVDPIDIMEQADEMYANDEYEPLNQFWTKYAEADLSAMTDEEYMAFTNEYGEIIVQMITDLLPELGYTEQKSQVIQVEVEDGIQSINEADFGIFDSYVISYP